MTDPVTPLAEVRDYDELHAALNARREQLNVSNDTLDDISGLPSRYVVKLLGPGQIRTIGKLSLGLLLGALGLKLIVAEDQDALRRVASRLTQRTKPGRWPPNGACLPAEHVEGLMRELLSEYARRGARARCDALSAKERSAIARRAARARWAAVRKAGLVAKPTPEHRRRGSRNGGGT